MIKGKKTIDTVQILRLVIQIAAFIFLPALFINTYGGLKQLVMSLVNHKFNFASEMPQIVAAIAIIPATALMGRFFCGWVCAFGALGDFIYRISGRSVKFRMSEKLDSALKKVKYVLLVFLAVAGWVLGVKIFSAANPWDAFGMLAIAGKAPDFAFVLQNLAPALVLLVGIMIGSVFIERFFCRYLCPLGAVFAVVSRLKLIRISKPSAQCGKCRVCTKNCAMGIPLYGKETIASGECIACMKCVPVCPRNNVSVALAGNDVRPMAAGAVAVAALAGAYYTGNFAMNLTMPAADSGITLQAQGAAVATDANPTIAYTTDDPTGTQSVATQVPSVTVSPGKSKSVAKSTPKPTQTPPASSLYKDGTYNGTGMGFRGASTTVSVSVKGDKITSLKVVSYGDDRQFFQAAYPVVSGEILQAQSTKVDAVSGATYSSNGIMSAVADALSKAKL